MKVLDHTRIFERYRGQWVVLDQSRTRVLAAGSSLQEALALYKKRYAKSIAFSVLKVPAKLVAFTGAI